MNLGESLKRFTGRETVELLESKGLYPVFLNISKTGGRSTRRVFIVSQQINYGILFFTLLELLRPIIELPYPPEAKPSLKELKKTVVRLPFRLQIRSSEALWCPLCQVEHCECVATVNK